MTNKQLEDRVLREDAVVGIDNMKQDADLQTAGETMVAFHIEDGAIVEFPEPSQFAAWIRLFKGNKIPYVSGLKTTNDTEWIEIPGSVFRNLPIQEDMETFRENNSFGMSLRSKDKDLDRWALLAGKRVRFSHESLRRAGFDKETNTPILDPTKCKEASFYKLSIVE